MTANGFFPALPNVYHLTNTLHLPWIIESGELRPHTNHLPGVGAVSYHWATANRTGDKTAMAVMVAKDRPLPWEEDLYRLVRFSLPGDAFLTWTEIIRRDGFTADQVAELVDPTTSIMANLAMTSGAAGKTHYHSTRC